MTTSDASAEFTTKTTIIVALARRQGEKSVLGLAGGTVLPRGSRPEPTLIRRCERVSFYDGSGAERRVEEESRRSAKDGNPQMRRSVITDLRLRATVHSHQYARTGALVGGQRPAEARIACLIHSSLARGPINLSGVYHGA